MKRVLKILGYIVSGFVLLIAGLAVWQWDTIRIFTRAQNLGGEVEDVPKPISVDPPELTRGPADWPRWRGFEGDSRSPMTGISKDWPLERVWEVGFLCQGRETATWSAPVVQGDYLVVCGRDETQDLVFCLNADGGQLIWKAGYAADAISNYGAGFRATPWIDEDRVYTFGRSGHVVCRSLLDGKEIWHKNVMDEGGEEPTWGHATSPLVIDNLLVVNGGGSARTIAYDKMTGAVIWKSGQGHAGYAAIRTMNLNGSPIVLTFHGKGLAGLEPGDGSPLFDIPWHTDHDVNATTPVVSDNRVFITSGYETGCALYRISDAGAKEIWRHTNYAAHHSDPHIIDGYLYGYSGLSVQNRGTFKCLDLKTGDVQWSSSEIGWGTCVFVDGHLLCGDIKGNLFLVHPNPKEFTLVTSMERALGKIRGPVWTMPVIANGKLFLRFNQTLRCYQL